MSLTNSRPRRWVRAAKHMGLAVALAATLSFAGPGGTTAAATPDEECRPMGGASSARVGWGAAHGQDANSVDAATAQRINASLRSRVARMVETGVLARTGARASGGPIRVRTHWHVITRGDGTGGVTRARLDAQLRVLNQAYAGLTAPSAARTPFRFETASVDVTSSDAWYDWALLADGSESPAAKTAKRRLHRGGWADLNVYVAGLGGGVLGYATYPQQSPLKLDGLVLLNESLPGGSAAPYNEGDTATHEAGHWLGLFHTFENACKAPGDYVRDTPYQDDGENIFSCGDDPRFPDDTCPQPGKDPVRNFMSYGDDACLDSFTDGQRRRMTQAWMAFRRGR